MYCNTWGFQYNEVVYSEFGIRRKNKEQREKTKCQTLDRNNSIYMIILKKCGLELLFFL